MTFVVIDGLGHVLTPGGQWSPDLEDAKDFDSVSQARASRPGHGDGTATSRVVFKSQVLPFQMGGCLNGQCSVPHRN